MATESNAAHGTDEPSPEQIAEVLASLSETTLLDEAELRVRCGCRSDRANAVCPLHN